MTGCQEGHDPGIRIEVDYPGEAGCVMRLLGRLDLSACDVIEKKLASMMDDGWLEFTVDLSEVGGISSFAAGLFLEIVASVEECGGSVCFVNPSPAVSMLVNMLEQTLDACGQKAHPSRMRRPAILIVDDDVETLDVLAAAFAAVDAEIIRASSVQSALDILEKHGNVHLIISDWCMPGGSGIYLLEEVSARWPWIERILYSGCDMQLREVIACLERGVFSRFITKPWDIGKLGQIADAILEQQRACEIGGMINRARQDRMQMR